MCNACLAIPPRVSRYSLQFFQTDLYQILKHQILDFVGRFFQPFFLEVGKKKSSMMSSSNFIDPLAIFYHSPNLLVQNPGFNPNVKSPFRQCWLDYHNGNDLISPWYIEKSPCTTYCIFISEKKTKTWGCVAKIAQHVFFSVQGSKSASLQKLNKASQIEKDLWTLKGGTTVSQTNIAT